MRHHRKSQERSMAGSLVHPRILGSSAHACAFQWESVALLGDHAALFPISSTLFCLCLVDSHVRTLGSASKTLLLQRCSRGFALTAPGSGDEGRNHSSSTSGFGQL